MSTNTRARERQKRWISNDTLLCGLNAVCTSRLLLELIDHMLPASLGIGNYGGCTSTSSSTRGNPWARNELWTRSIWNAHVAKKKDRRAALMQWHTNNQTHVPQGNGPEYKMKRWLTSIYEGRKKSRTQICVILRYLHECHSVPNKMSIYRDICSLSIATGAPKGIVESHMVFHVNEFSCPLLVCVCT